MAIGIGLLSLSAWIRRQPWLKVIYRHFPVALRNRVSEVLATRAGQHLKFRRTPNWGRGSLLREPVATSCENAGAEGVGVNIFAYARGQFGLAEGARLYARALLAEGYPVAIHDIAIDIPHGMNDFSLDSHIRGETPYGINLIFVNPDYLEQAMASIGKERLDNRYTIACWFWELEKFPDEWLPAFLHVDEVMVSTDFIRNAVAKVTDKPVWSVPLPVTQSPDSGLVRDDFGLDEGDFIFLNSFDFNSFVARKNPEAAIEAFRLAFADDHPNVKLLIKSSNGHRHPEKLRALLNVAGTDRRIIVRDEIIDRSDMGALQRCADAYVSLHRAEGFGLGLAECMHMGKPVIATAWSGNMDFMTPANSCLVDYQLVAVGDGEYLHHAGQRWAEPDVDVAASYMRRLVEDPDFAVSVGAQAARDIRDRLSPQRSAQRIIRRVEALSCSGALTSSGVASPGVTI
ncbi:glycosyltransferase family 4 protein [Rhodanobacter sp. AS-Z3]|nr:glycosyltransferase family 4 protein [Rhodanobacter sp. AS-Z3]WEN16918.1 glycosyltransferase family 4 protein [Rhodanobacter sp. AS-Z3]